MNKGAESLSSGNQPVSESRHHKVKKAWRLRQLWRKLNSEEASLVSTNRLLELLKTQPQDASICIDWSGKSDGSVNVILEAVGVNDSFDRDLEWACRGAQVWEPIEVYQPACPDQVYEVFGALPGHLENVEDILSPTKPEVMLPGRRKPTWPLPRSSNSQMLMETLNEVGGHLRVRLGKAEEIECEMAEEAFTSTEKLMAGSDVGNYLGTPMRLRVFMGANGSQGFPSRLWIALCSWAVGIRYEQITNRAEAEKLWCSQEALAGAAQPEGLVKVFARLPVADTQARIIGLPAVEQDPAVVPLSDHTQVREEAGGMRLGTATTTTGDAADVYLNQEGALQHLQVVGASGAGKSTLAAAMVHSLVAQGRGGIVLDPHGQLVQRIADELPAEALERCLFIDYADLKHPVPINLFHCGDFDMACSKVVEIMYLTFDPTRQGIVGPRFERIIRQLAELLNHIYGPDLPLTLIPELLLDKKALENLARAVSNISPELTRSVMTEIVTNRSSDYAELIAWASSKFERMLSSQALRAALETGADALDLNEAMASNKIVLVNLASPKIGRFAAQMLGMLWLAKLALAVPNRQDDYLPFHVVVDEAHLFQESLLSQMLAEGRKFGIALTLLHQHMGQLSMSLLEALRGNASSVIAFRTSVRDAPEVDERLGVWPGGSLSRLPNLSAAATLATHYGQTQPFTLKVDHNEQVRAGVINGEPVVHAFDQVLSRSHKQLVQPFNFVVPKQMDNVRALTEQLQEINKKAGLQDDEAYTSTKPNPTFMEEWIARRKKLTNTDSEDSD